jgi:DNA-directed RNA polymerase alpha subunit
MGLPVRVVDCLERQGIFTANDLLHRTAKQLRRIPMIGQKTMRQIYHCMARLGFRRGKVNR